ncbi:MAG TPA: hypothetical protein VHA75_16970, partial [Rugosimonospora sp.]|nr:hypothetical protein [Rugosimonospora sp.]
GTVVFWSNRGGASREVGFQALATVGQPIPMGGADASPSATLTAVAGDRAYLAYGDDSGLHVIVHPLAGGDDHTVDLSTTAGANVQWQALVARDDAVLVYSYEYSGDKPVHIYALDPGSGAVRWDLHLTSSDSLVPAGPVLLWSDPDGHAVHGLDPKTGNERWRVDDPQQDGYAQATRLQAAYSGTDLDAPSPVGDDAPLVLAGSHVIQTVADGSARVIDVSNGHLVSANHVAESTDLVVGSGDRFYVASNSDAYRVTSYSLAKPDDDSATKNLYTAPDAAHITAMVPCGDGVCVLDRSNSDPKTATVRMVDASGAHWNRLIAGADRLVPLASGVIVTGTDGDAFTQVLNASGEPVSLGTNGAQATGARVNGTSVLLFKGTLSTYPATVPLTGVGTRSGKVTPLGTLDGVRAAACSWNSRYLVCPQESQFRVWTFAGA